jgi:dephospho-CoA kinase
MLNVALTGNVAAGKSSVVRWFGRWGAAVIDADALTREVQRPGTPTLRAIVEQFGSEILNRDGTLDRARLRSLVLIDGGNLAALNAIVHPAIKLRRRELMAEAESRGERVVINDIPLLFEVLDPTDFDVVVLVDAPAEVRRERLLRRGLQPEDADRLMAAQQPAARKRELSDIVIDNAGSLQELREAAREAWDRICELAAR